jgi:monomeric isocitrate dehydrogenase
MSGGDFYGSEQSYIMPAADSVNIVFTPADRKLQIMVLKVGLA